jgi:DNA-binding response OmpR family regulator
MRPRILVADDDPALLSALAEALELLGATVVRASTGAELIEHLADEEPIDVVVTDISMPLMSGLHAMHSARYLGFMPPIVVITALDDERIPAQVAALGPNVLLLRKPFELSELSAAVQSLLASSSQNEQAAP